MTKNELMEMARECGLEFREEECAQSVFVSLALLHNAILERAAVECDWVPSMDRKNDECAKAVRKLKL